MRATRKIAALVVCFLAGFAAVAFAGIPTPDAGPAPDAAPATTAAPQPAGAPLPDAVTGGAGTVATSTTTSSPLTVTPPLGGGDYVFPVAGEVAWGDSYGAPRPDLPSGWHHGDDLFAPLGAPLVAVADGTVSSVGWEPLGGWRLWLTTASGDAFYYAHLSGYTRLALRGGHVRAGQVLGFVGNTGDADGGAYHLHFQIHPASLRSLGEDGAVNPTSYLARWRHVDDVRFATPVLPPLPGGAAGAEAEAAFSGLLAAPSVQRTLALVAAAWKARLAKLREEREQKLLLKTAAQRKIVRKKEAPAPPRPSGPANVYRPPLPLEQRAPAQPVRAATLSSPAPPGLQIAGLAAVLLLGAAAVLLYRSRRLSRRGFRV
jgi:hypothetical protein